MISTAFLQEAKRLCSFFYDGPHGFIWIYSGAEAFFVSALMIRKCSIEERTFLHQLHQSHPEQSFQLPEHHVLLSFTEQKGSPHHFSRKNLQEAVILAGCRPEKEPLLQPLTGLLSEREQELTLRSQLSLLLERQQAMAQSLKEENERLRQQLETNIQPVLRSWQSEQPELITVSSSCVQQLTNIASGSEVLNVLNRTIELLRFLHPGTAVFHIEPHHLPSIPPNDRQPKENMPQPLSSHQRAELLLDKYEIAAGTAKRNGQAVNGKHIAENLDPPISPPAITDALKKNRKAISSLLEQFPERWPLLRRHLKPVRELNEHFLFRVTA